MTAAGSHIAKLVSPAHRLAALVFTDIVNSTQLKSRLRSSYFALLKRHNELFEAGIAESPSAEIIKHTGDGYFASFATASDAVHFALLFQARMKLEPWSPEKVEVRLGIHIGEVVIMDMAGRKDIVGLSADIAARLMSLAVGGQILLTDTAFNDARQYVNSSPAILGKAPPLRWMAHGKYLCRGTDDPLEVYEVGVENVFPLKAPADSEKVKRVVPHDQESTLGWRPAMSLPVPGRPGWELLRKLGEGGFGEVWLGEHQRLKELRVFKFCFDTERLRGLKREYMLFRLLREALGRRTDIAALYEVKLDEPPFFLESEYSAGGNLLDWAQAQGGIQTLDLKTRLELLAKVSDALAAAHSVGVIHKDIKPSNILINQSSDGHIDPQLADFGISAILDRSRLKAHNVTEVGFTEMQSDSNTSFGTRMYLPPESTREATFTMRGDIYALGVMLYQFVIGDLTRPLGPGWERDVSDPIMRSDIASIVEGDPERRVAAASEVSRLLRSQDARRAEIAKAQQEAAAHQRRRKFRRVAAVAAVAIFALCGVGFSLEAMHIHHLNAERDTAVAQAKALSAEQARTQAVAQFLLGVIKGADVAKSTSAASTPTAETLVLDASRQLDSTFTDQSEVTAQVQMCFAETLRNFGDSQDSYDHYSRAAHIYQRLFGDDDHRTLLARFGEGAALLRDARKFALAGTILKDVYERQKATLGPNDRDTLASELFWGAAIYNIDGPQAAEPIFKDSADRRMISFQEDDKDTIQSISAYGMVERDLGHFHEAEKLIKQALDWRVAHLGAQHFSTLPSLLSYGSILIDLGRADEALPLLKTLVDRRLELDPKQSKLDVFRAKAAYADALTAVGRYDQARPLYLEAIAGFRAHEKAAGPKQIMAAECGYAELLIATGHSDLAEPCAKEAFQIFNADDVAGPRLTARAEYDWTMALMSAPPAFGGCADVLSPATASSHLEGGFARPSLAGYTTAR